MIERWVIWLSGRSNNRNSYWPSKKVGILIAFWAYTVEIYKTAFGATRSKHIRTWHFAIIYDHKLWLVRDFDEWLLIWFYFVFFIGKILNNPLLLLLSVLGNEFLWVQFLRLSLWWAYLIIGWQSVNYWHRYTEHFFVITWIRISIDLARISTALIHWHKAWWTLITLVSQLMLNLFMIINLLYVSL